MRELKRKKQRIKSHCDNKTIFTVIKIVCTDANQGEIKLEAIHQPLYDSQSISVAGTASYFQNPAGRGKLLTNVTTAGQLSMGA